MKLIFRAPNNTSCTSRRILFRIRDYLVRKNINVVANFFGRDAILLVVIALQQSENGCKLVLVNNRYIMIKQDTKLSRPDRLKCNRRNKVPIYPYVPINIITVIEELKSEHTLLLLSSTLFLAFIDVHFKCSHADINLHNNIFYNWDI